MNALRNLHFLPRFHPRIECPHLETLSLGVGEWVLPSWIPSTLRALTLHATPRRALPDLGDDIRPSEFTIRLSGSGPYSRLISWARNCINRLPFPEHLRRLAIDLKKEVTQSDESMGFPKPEDYQNLSQVLQKLLERSPLERIDLAITINVSLRGHVAESDWRDETTREVRVFEEALLPLLETGILHVVFAFNLQREMGGEVLSAARWMTVYGPNAVSTPSCSFVPLVPTL
ncbi:hypothetical protein EYR40_002150 [Pleurotus pulmonarius]|nr:hypothetical protein EYR36_011444 [Pleurotus pulmonarius]KAF4585313.1 hypothetical protein EYR40_002150 [Pleurotus pulmonarius]KAF4607653.1 hypothetical protein EYR38_001726 [Pleurotus pulmonarius]